MNKEKRNDCIAVYGNLIEITKNGQLTTDELGQLVVAMYDYELEEIEPDIAEKTQPFQFAWSFILPSLRARKRRQGRNARYQENKKLKEMAQNQEIIENECNNTKLQPNTSFYPTCDSKNQEYDYDVNDNQEVLDDFAKLLDSDEKYLRSNTFDDCFFEHNEIMNFVVMSGLTNEPFIKVFNEKKIA